MTAAQRRVVATVMGCHFVAAFAALGMPPFFALILEKDLHVETGWLAGWLYVLPIFFTALGSPWWGRLADRYGRKPLLLRAQLGLAASFLLAGYAPNLWVFAAALVLQGLLGGTFSASNAYLAGFVAGPALARSLTLMQWSARAALVAAPAALGGLLAFGVSPLVLYRYLALLPAAAALCIWWLPAAGGAHAAAAGREAAGPPVLPARRIWWLQAAFIFATVVTFPYFVSFLQAQGLGSTALAGLLFGLPHLVYLGVAMMMARHVGRGNPVAALALAFALLAASLLGQALAATPAQLALWRLAMGLGMTAAYVCLHGLITRLVDGGNAGITFGRFESSAKWGAVGAGIAAGALAQVSGTRAPFLLGAAVMCGATAYLAALLARRPVSLIELEKPCK